MATYTVEWGHYRFNGKGEKISQIQDGDIENINALSEKDAIEKAHIPDNAEWCHAYIGSSKWL